MTTRDFTANVISASKVVPDGNFKTSAASGVWDINEALDLIKGGNWPNAANLDPASFVDGLFQTHLYTGNSSTRTITNNIDLSGKGGLVWIKDRDSGSNAHLLYDTERGAYNALKSSSTAVNQTRSTGLTGFTSSGFTLGSLGAENGSSNNKVSWTFREQPKFFDIVTYTGDGNADRQIDHNLGSTPGMMIVKKYAGSTTRWAVYHRSLGTGKFLNLDDTAATVTQNDHWQTAPNATQFTVETNGNVNNSGDSYVAYLFAHNDDDGGFGEPGDQDIIKCGSYTTDSSGNAVVDLGFEPQFVITKGDNYLSNWQIHDVMRGAAVGGNAQTLRANNSDPEVSQSLKLEPNPTGFTSSQGVNGFNGIYMAIRRGPLAEPTSATDVFAIDTQVNQDPPLFDSGFPVDFALTRNVSSTANWAVGSRLIQGKQLNTDNENAETSNPVFQFDFMDGWNSETLSTNSNVYSWMWKRAPGYFDVVCYDGSGSNRTISHNLGVAPEMIWVKSRSNSGHGWMTYHTGTGATHYMMVNSTAAAVDLDVIWNDTAPTSSVFSVGTGGSVNDSGKTYIAYLFASVAGVSKVGSYTGNGTSQNIDCGFSGNARFVLIKNASQSDNWMVYDSVRGINSGTEGYLRLNSTAAEYTSGDHIDPYSGGFAPTSNDPSTNRTGNTYIFYAIA